MKIRIKQAQQLLAEAAQRYPKDEHARLNHFLANFRFEASIGRPRFVSQKRQTEIGNTLHLCLRELGEMRRPVLCLSHLKRKSALELLKKWQEQGLAVGTIEDRISVLRKLLDLVGRSNVLPRGREWKAVRKGAGLAVRSRSELPQMKKGWQDEGVDPQVVIDAIRLDCEVAASCMEMMWAFGLRVNESVQIQVGLSMKDGYLVVSRGTKGGKMREVPFSTNDERRVWQQQVLGRAKTLCDRHQPATLSVPGRKLSQMKNHLRYLAREHGITRKGKLGVTFHGLRHQFATTEFRERTGLPAPILGEQASADYAASWEPVRAAYLHIARAMGHERPSISGAYLGRVKKLAREQQQCLRGWELKLQAAAAAFDQAHVQDAFIVGLCADGVAPRDGEPLPIAARMRAVDSITVAGIQLDDLAGKLTEVLGLDVVVNPWTSRKHPNGFEIFLHDPTAGGAAHA